jgi:phenylacetate-CoA ligase
MNESLSRFATSLKYTLFNAGLSREIRNSERNLLLGKDMIAALQLQKLKDIVTYAYCNCKFYNKLYRGARLAPRDITCFTDFLKLPMIRKEDINENLEDFVSSRVSPNRMESVHTGGTTGIPLRLYRDRSKMDLMNAIFIRTIKRWGCGVGS